MTAPPPRADGNTSVAIAALRRDELDQRLRADAVPRDWGRVVSSSVTGAATLFCGGGTLAVATVTVMNGFHHLPWLVPGVLLTVVLAACTRGLARMTWRLARSLPLGGTPTELRCSFCGKTQREVKRLIAGPKVYICDECIWLCNDIIAREREAL